MARSYRRRQARARRRQSLRIAFVEILNPLDDLREANPELARRFWVAFRRMSRPEQQRFARQFMAVHGGNRSEEIKMMIKLARAPQSAWKWRIHRWGVARN